MSLSQHQQIYVDSTIHHVNVKKAISSKYEYEFKKLLNSIGTEGKDWFHQPPFYNEEESLVAIPDFAFHKEKIIIELDGESHNRKQQKERDILRDKVFKSNGYFVFRIKVPIEQEKLSYWKVYIQEMLKLNLEEIKKNKTKKGKKSLFTQEEFDTLLRKKIACTNISK